jgi:hypothetical protein
MSETEVKTAGPGGTTPTWSDGGAGNPGAVILEYYDPAA